VAAPEEERFVKPMVIGNLGSGWPVARGAFRGAGRQPHALGTSRRTKVTFISSYRRRLERGMKDWHSSAGLSYRRRVLTRSIPGLLADYVRLLTDLHQCTDGPFAANFQ